MLLTGPATGTYYHMAQNMYYVAKRENIPVEVATTNGALENIEQLLAAEGNGAVMAFMQEDVMDSLKRSTEEKHKALAERLVATPLYREEIHIVADKSIQNLKALDGKKIAVGQEGSGTWVTAANIFNLLGIRPSEMLRASPEAALAAVLEGQADAMIAVAGKPMHVLLNLMKLKKEQPAMAEKIDNLRLLPVTEESLHQQYLPAQLDAEDYPFLTEPVNSISLRAYLVAEKLEAGSPQCEQRKKLAELINAAMPVLRSTGHPKWQDLAQDSGPWPKDDCFPLKAESEE